MRNLKKVVFFGAHTDDEMVCAGTLHRLAKTGVEVHVITFAPAATVDDRTGTEKSVEIVIPEWNKALDLIGVKYRKFLQFIPSSDFSVYTQKICQEVYDYCEKHKPDATFILSPEDENTAHSVLGTECERVMRGRVPITIRCQFPWNYNVGRGNLFVVLDQEDLQVKKTVIDIYESQKFRYNYAHMFECYALADGYSVKSPPCEKFEIIRCVL